MKHSQLQLYCERILIKIVILGIACVIFIRILVLLLNSNGNIFSKTEVSCVRSMYS